jgi:hypothetical protein
MIGEKDFENAKVGYSFKTNDGRAWPVVRLSENGRLFVEINGKTGELIFLHGLILDENLSEIEELKGPKAFIKKC